MSFPGPEVALKLLMVVVDEKSALLESLEPKLNKGASICPFSITDFFTNELGIVGVGGIREVLGAVAKGKVKPLPLSAIESTESFR